MKADDFNLSKHLYTHLLGENHTHQHRLVAGTVVIFVGVLVAKSGEHLLYIFHISLDAMGYMLHGIGTLPFIELLEKNRKEPLKEGPSKLKEPNRLIKVSQTIINKLGELYWPKTSYGVIVSAIWYVLHFAIVFIVLVIIHLS